MNFSIEKTAQEYVNKRFSQASILEKEKIIKDWADKLEASEALVMDFKKRIGDPKAKKILDAGSGSGGVSIAFAKAGAEVCGIDIEKELYEIAQEHAKSYGVAVNFFLYDGSRLPFENDYFDYAVSVSVLEHTTDPEMYLFEILRVVKPEGKLYLAFPNKLWPKETHTQIWLLTYLPAFLRPTLVKILKRNPLEENNLHFYTYFDLERMLGDWRIVPEEGESRSGWKKWLKSFLNIFGIPYKTFLSHISVILQKNERS